MADKKISQLTNITGADVVDSTDELAIVDASSNETKAITREELFKSVGGATFNGNISLGDNNELQFGDSNDLFIKFNGTNGSVTTATGNLYLTNTADNQDVYIQSDDGSGGITNYFAADGSTGEAKMYYYGAEKLNTTSTGVDVAGSLAANDGATLGTTGAVTGGTADGLNVVGASNGLLAKFGGNRTVFDRALQLNEFAVGGVNSVGFQFNAEGNGTQAEMRFAVAGTDVVTITDDHNVLLPDNSELRLGDSSDLILEHNGSNGDIRNSTNDMLIRNLADDRDVIIQSDNGSGGTADYFRADGSSGEAKMFYYGAEKLNTKSTGVDVTGALDVSGALSKGSGSFKIDHPLNPETHHLVHSFVEAPQADNIYRGKVSLVDGSATVNLDETGRMTEGTFVLLNTNIQCFTSNEDGWTAIRGSVSGNALTIEAQDATCTDTVSWLVIGERHDPHMLNTNWTDEAGRVITEPEKQSEEEE